MLQEWLEMEIGTSSPTCQDGVSLQGSWYYKNNYRNTESEGSRTCMWEKSTIDGDQLPNFFWNTPRLIPTRTSVRPQSDSHTVSQQAINTFQTPCGSPKFKTRVDPQSLGFGKSGSPPDNCLWCRHTCNESQSVSQPYASDTLIKLWIFGAACSLL